MKKAIVEYFIRENSKSKIVKKLIRCSGIMSDWKMMISRLLRIFDVRRIYSRIKRSIKSNKIFYFIIFVYVIVMSTITILKNNVFLTSGFDLGIYNQALSTTLFENKFFYETADLSFNPGGSFFGVHFSPILFLLLPFYAVYPHVENLLVMQTAILAVGAFPVYWMVRDKISKRVASLIALIYLLYPPLIMLNLNDFHIQAFTSTFFLFSVYYLEQEKWPHFFTFMLLAIFTIEFAPIIGVFVAFYAFILYRRKKLTNGRKTSIYIAVAALLAILFLIIALQTKAVFNNTTSPISTTFKNLFENPVGVPYEISVDLASKIFYIIGFLAPLAFLPLLAPEALIMTLPWIGLSFISPYAPYHSVFYQYTAFVIPFVMVALPKGIEHLNLRQGKKIVPLLALATIISLIYLPLTPGAPWNYQLPVPNDNSEMRHDIISLIPLNASVLTENDMFPHLSGRSNVYMYNATLNYPISTDYVLVDLTSQWYMWEPDISGSKQNPRGYVETAMEERSYGVFASSGGTILLKKNYTGEPVLFEPYVAYENYKNLILGAGKSGYGSIVQDTNSTSGYVLFHSTNDEKDPFFNGPYTGLPFGLFKVTYFLKFDDAEGMKQNETLLTLDVTADAGNKLLAQRNVTGGDVPFSRKWFGASIYVGLHTPAQSVEFRGRVFGDHNVYLDYVSVEQISPLPVSETNFDFETFDTYARSVKPYVSWVQRGTVVDGVMTHLKGAGDGTFWYGPYYNCSSLAPSNYTARFWLRLDEPYNGKILDLVVATNGGSQLLAESKVYSFDFNAINTWQSFDVNFELPKYEENDTNTIEFAGMRALDFAPVSFLLVELYPSTGLPQQPLQTVFGSKDLKVDHGGVFNGIITHARGAGSGAFWHGPYTYLPQGNYTAKFWLKLDEAYNGTLVDIDVSINSGNVLKSLTVTSSDFEKIDKWQSFDVRFTLQNSSNNVEFRGVDVREFAPISFLSVEVNPYNETGLPPISKIVFDNEDLRVAHGRVSSDGTITHVRGSGNGTFWYGPYYNYSSLPAGNYTARFWLRLDGDYDGPIMDLVVATNNAAQLLGKLGVNSGDFKAINTWQSFDVDFELPKYKEGDSLEFAGWIVRDLAPVSLLFVEVYPDTG
jgi:uncharacterized membrane protein